MRVAGQLVSLRTRPRALLVVTVLATTLAALGVLALSTGRYPIPVATLVEAVTGQAPRAIEFVVFGMRLPRMLAAILVGLALGISGALFQSLTRNPLGSPDLIGLNSGAATGAILALLVGGGALVTSTAAITGGLATAVVVYLLASIGGLHTPRIVLVGIGLSALLTAVNHYLLTRARLAEAQHAAAWLAGGLNGRGWGHVASVAVAIAVLAPVALLLAARLRIMALGDDLALALGVSLSRSRLMLLVLAVTLSAVATATAGPVPFVALAAPQLVARLVGGAGPHLVSAGLMGAVLLVAADIAAQQAVPGVQLPTGVLTGLLGGIYLAWLLTREWRTSAQ
ncbi:ABC transporter permease [Longimycelium tulufanense]|uniref:ABC transporter permease n=1 Tax=Longimycelium tulufanense TaxID=907463 RepID=A0A8J3CBH7_9PSEU|nr:iron chelate uptake ABC transporter family permease subunit [Longimycelium tulufanense]GGM49061.1 ABC transporter permease [Longimycelium tulufanense]